MASSLLALLDDIATVLDDVSVMTKVAAKKTAGVLGDDLALNAQQVTGVRAERELPVVAAVARGSLKNKVILVPAALAISAWTPFLVTPLLILGGAYLCFEGVEKLVHKFVHRAEDQAHKTTLRIALADPNADLVAVERDKIKGAVRTDFILSAEIIVITLGIVATRPFGERLAVLVAIALLMTVGVYGLVAGIVKLDDLGLALTRRTSPTARAIGRGIVAFAPWLMRALSVAGTAAMFLVGGGIIVHGVGALQHLSESWTSGLAGPVAAVAGGAFDGGVGVAIGAAALALVTVAKKLVSRR